MQQKQTRREFLQTAAAAGGVAYLAGSAKTTESLTAAAAPKPPYLVSPGCRKSKVRVAKLYMGIPGALWPTPKMDLNEEMQKYEGEFSRMNKEFADVNFVVNELVTSPEQVQALKEKMAMADGVLAIHLSMGVGGIFHQILAAGKPTVLFAAPYSGHDWTGFASVQRGPQGALLDCMLTSDTSQLAAAVRPFRAIHHLREAKILNLTTHDFTGYANAVKEKFGTEMVKVSLEEVEKAYESIPDGDAEAETTRWIRGATKVVEPTREDIFRSCKLALAFEKMLDEHEATMMTVDCYGTMWRKTPAYPCVGFARLNNMGLGGMCESDLRSAVTQMILQGLCGKPGFVGNPTMDVSKHAIALAHCLGTPKMDGPDKPPARYTLRDVMERQEGVTPHVFMEIGRRSTTALLVGMDTMFYFTGDIIEAPDLPRGCRTKITVKVDGDVEKLWQEWTLWHPITCYGDLTEDLKRFCRFTKIKMVNQAA